jgi:regulator of protease activity HflC (stomatin/prohibitin superfamily)
MNVVSPLLSDKRPELKKTLLMPDFRFGAFNLTLLILIMGLGALLQLRIGQPAKAVLHLRPEVLAVVAAAFMGSLLIVIPKWQKLIGLGVAFWVILRFGYQDVNLWPLHISCYLGLMLSASVQIAQQWERGIVLRLGKYQSLRGPGLFMIIPLIDRVDRYIDHRVRATDFRAETTLTRDTVPVNVDAIAFWLVWDAKMSVLEVENFEDAVTLSAQTALRDAIGRHELSEMLTDREAIGAQIQKVLDKKTDPWGITIQSIEIRDVVIPKGLEDAMSRVAQAERERQSRVILGTAETEIAAKFAKASEAYRDNPVALHLRAMNMVYEGLKAKGSMVIVPSSAVETMGLGALGGLTALGQPVAGGGGAGPAETVEPSAEAEPAPPTKGESE